jgi:hypothetical protein
MGTDDFKIGKAETIQRGALGVVGRTQLLLDASCLLRTSWGEPPLLLGWAVC